MKTLTLLILLFTSFAAMSQTTSLSVGDSADRLIEVLEQVCVTPAEYNVTDYGKYTKSLPHTTVVSCYTEDDKYLLVRVKDAVVDSVDLL